MSAGGGRPVSSAWDRGWPVLLVIAGGDRSRNWRLKESRLPRIRTGFSGAVSQPLEWSSFSSPFFLRLVRSKQTHEMGVWRLDLCGSGRISALRAK